MIMAPSGVSEGDVSSLEVTFSSDESDEMLGGDAMRKESLGTSSGIKMVVVMRDESGRKYFLL